MSVVLDKVTEIQDQVIDYIGSVKEPVVNGVQSVVNFVMDRVPEIPAVPFADKLATPAEVVDAEFAFAGRLLDANKEIAVGVVKAATPLTNKLLDRKAVKSAAKKPATKSTPKAATKAA
jgi:hypothetical protein